MSNFFKLKQHGTNVRTEVIAGVTTFFAMAYIVIVNPDILSKTGMSFNGVFVATVAAAVMGTLVMALFANVPYAQASGMGMNAFFTYTICGSMGFDWREALGMVFICGVIGLIVTVTKIRRLLIKSIPKSLQSAIGASLGLFIAFIGLIQSGLVSLGGEVPSISSFADKGSILTVVGLIIIIILLVLKVKGAIFFGIVAATVVGIPLGVVDLAGIDWISVKQIGDVKEVAFSFFGDPGFLSMFNTPSKAFMSLTAIFAFSLTDIFDTIGTFIGTGRVSGVFDDIDEAKLMDGVGSGFNSKLEKALFADATGTVIGSIAGTSNVTTYVESAAGISVGGRTGLASLTTAALLLICLPFSGIAYIIPSAATAPALVCVGVMMMGSVAGINWGDFEESIPAFLAIAFTAFGYSISYGIAAGLIFHCIVKIAVGKFKELNLIVCAASLLFLVNFIVNAVQKAGVLK